MRISLLNLLLLIAVAAMATALYSFKRTADANLEAVKQQAAAERKSYAEWRSGELAKSHAENQFLRNLSGLPSLTDHGRIQYHRYTRTVHGAEHGILAVLDPQKNYAVQWLRRWGSDEAASETKREEYELVIEAAPQNQFANRMLELRIFAHASEKEATTQWAFAGHINPILVMNESMAMAGTISRNSREYLWCKMLRDLKVPKTPQVKQLKDCFNLETKIQQRPTQLCWITGYSDDTKDLQSIYVTIEELTPERLAGLASAPRFHEYKHPQGDP
jgi:hypothetical protein